MSGAATNGHARNSSRSSVNTITGSGAAAATSPGGSGGAFSRAASIAKRSSVNGKQTSGKDGASDAAAAPPSPATRLTPRARRAPSTSMARKGSTSSSTSNSASESHNSAAHDGGATSDDAAAGINTELSRMSREQLVALVARERREREEVDSRLVALTADHASTSSAHDELLSQSKLHETKLKDAYATTERFESELAERLEELDGLRGQLRDAAKEARDAQKSYTEQLETFEAERETWRETKKMLSTKYNDLSQQYESTLAQLHTRMPSGEESVASPAPPANGTASTALSPSLSLQSQPRAMPLSSPTFSIPASTLEELQSLQARVSELVAEKDHLAAEQERLQAEFEEVQRVNADLQEENENYEVLLGERMLAGLSGNASIADSGIGSTEISNLDSGAGSVTSEGTSRSRPTSSLDRLEEESLGEDGELLSGGSAGAGFKRQSTDFFESSGDGTLASGAVAARVSTDRTGPVRGARQRDSMLGLGGGLNLEAELSRASQEEQEEEAQREKERKKAAAAARRKQNQSTHLGGREGDPIPSDVEALQKEVKLLRQENKGLTTYVGKIIERVIGMEGFEKILAADKDYRASPPMAPMRSDQGAPAQSASGAPALPPRAASGPTASAGPPRPSPLRTQSAIVGSHAGADDPTSPTKSTGPAVVAATGKKNRLSMDWITSSLWRSSSGSTQPVQPTPANFKPMRLSAAAPIASAGPARRLSIEEDEEDQITRARLQSEMRLLGIDNHGSPVLHGTSPGGGVAGRFGRSPSQSHGRKASGSSLAGLTGASPRPPSLPPKDDGLAQEQSMRHELENGRASGFTELSNSPNPGSASLGDTVRVRGHRKRPSAGNRESLYGAGSLASSVGLGLSYSKDSSSTWSAGSPSAASLADGVDVLRDDKRRSDASASL